MTIPSRRFGAILVTVLAAIALTGTAATSAAAATAPSVVTGPPDAISVTAATLSGDVDPNGLGVDWHFDYGTTQNYGSTTTSTSAPAVDHEEAVEVRIGGLTPDTTYHYRLVATTSQGTAYGSDASFRTPEHPPAIGRPSTSGIGDAAATVDVSINPHGLVTNWYVRYGVSPTLSATSATRSAGTGITAVDVATRLTRLALHTTYNFEVVARNAAGTRVSAVAAFVTTGRPVITSVAVASLSPTTATLSGVLMPDGHTTRAYFQYGATPSFGSHTASASLGASLVDQSLKQSITGLVANTTYYFRLVARNGDGTVVSAGSSFTTPGPTLASSQQKSHFGRAITLSGTVPRAVANEPVELFAESAGLPSFAEIATVLTSANGTWAYEVPPRLTTTYKVLWESEASPTVTVRVTPGVLFREQPGGRFVTHVAGARSFAGHLIRLQRLEHGRWRTVAAKALNRASAASLYPRLPSGTSRLRFYLTGFQAGPGYLAGYSAVHLYRKA